MNALNKLVPGITSMIRADHAAVMATFHTYRAEASPERKRAIAESICTAAEIHARLEEEIFYPAMREAAPEQVQKSGPEHDAMRREIAELRSVDPASAAFDERLHGLMRTILHHVADEETTLLPEAERVLADRLGELGLRMSRRRMELAAPRAGEIAVNAARAHPGVVATVLALVVVGGFFAVRDLAGRRPVRLLSRRGMERLVQRPAKQIAGYLRHA